MINLLEAIKDTEPWGHLFFGDSEVSGGKIAEKDIPEGLTISGGYYHEEVNFYSAKYLTFSNFHMELPKTEKYAYHGGVSLTGGDWCTIERGTIIGGAVAGQINIGKDDNKKTVAEKVATNWIVSNVNCSGGELWGTYPQAHAVYVYTDPNVEMYGRFIECKFEQESGAGAVVKVGGTGFWPWQEGARGVSFEDCYVKSSVGPDGRAQVVLLQGAKTTNVEFRNCQFDIFNVTGEERPMIYAADGAFGKFIDCEIAVENLELNSSWYSWNIWDILTGKHKQYAKGMLYNVDGGVRNIRGINWMEQ